jgi:hypothetical protein
MAAHFLAGRCLAWPQNDRDRAAPWRYRRHESAGSSDHRNAR